MIGLLALLTACGARVSAEPVVSIDNCGGRSAPAVVCSSRTLADASRGDQTVQRVRAGDLAPLAVDLRGALPDLARAAVDRVNGERARAGAPPLQLDDRLTVVAAGHATDQATARRTGHEGSSGSSVADRVAAAGVRWRTLGESVAAGYRDAADLVSGWMRSPANRKNLLNPEFTDVGVGVAAATDGTYYWTMDFAC